ncbi:MFS transporter [Candidatus Daviesbacteria bacterium]|nr:MFS transporter [Candidatus Daviesbacteria bacterium]
MNRKNIFLWSLYDFANSIAVIVFFLYFSQWLVIDNKVPDIWYNLIFVGSTILLLLTAPVVGSIADKIGVRLPFLNVATVLMFVFLLGSSLFATFAPGTTFFVALAAILFLFSNYFYQFCFTFYNAFLHDLAPAKLTGFVSGLGQSSNWLGQITGLLITLPLATGAIYLAGHAGRAQTFLPAILAFFLLALPMMLFFKEKRKPEKVSIDLGGEYKNSLRDFISLCKLPGMGRYLLGYFFFNDALLTASNNFPIFMEQVFKVSDSVKSTLLLGILATSAIGALITGWISDKVGLKKSLIIILATWLVILPALSVITNFTYFVIVAVIMGFFYGATWTVTRAVMSYLTPKNRLNNAFSYYTMAERFSTFLGPVVWGLVTLLLVNAGAFRYRIAALSMTIFILIGLIIIRKIPSHTKNI